MKNVGDEQLILRPLVVDLDGTLVKTDTLVEMAIVLLKREPQFVFILPLWLWRGRAFLKRQVGIRTRLPVDVLPYNEELMIFLKERRVIGQKLVLATAADKKVALAVADHLNIFFEVLASDGKVNLLGKEKAKVLQSRFGRKGYDYVGDSWRDVLVWKGARKVLIVSDSKAFIRKVSRLVSVGRIFRVRSSVVSNIIKEIRARHWVKNILVFVPLLAAHKIMEIDLVIASIVAFVSFSLVASSVYVLNDLFDLEADRRHSIKKNRPLASGELSIYLGLILVAVLLTTGLAVAALLSRALLALLVLYFLLNVGYSMFLKKVVLVDVVLLTLLYVMRIFAGGVAVNVEVSTWLVAFAVFLFLSLALVKRFVELGGMKLNEKNGRSYMMSDVGVIGQMGVTSGLISVLVLVLYISSVEVTVLYSRPIVLWLVVLLWLYWIERVWLLVYRGAVDEDPVVFAVKDYVSWWVGMLIILVVILAL